MGRCSAYSHPGGERLRWAAGVDPVLPRRRHDVHIARGVRQKVPRIQRNEAVDLWICVPYYRLANLFLKLGTNHTAVAVQTNIPAQNGIRNPRPQRNEATTILVIFKVCLRTVDFAAQPEATSLHFVCQAESFLIRLTFPKRKCYGGTCSFFLEP